jgi:Pectate lyase superfamily protein
VTLKTVLSWFVTLCCATSVAYAGPDIVPPARRVPWNAGVPGDIPTVPIVTSVLAFGAHGDGVTDDAPAFQAAINSVTTVGAVHVPSGSYLLRRKVSLKSGVVLRGDGPTRTHLLIDHNSDALEMATYQRGDWVAVTNGLQKGAAVVTVADATHFIPGRYIEIQQDNDPAVMYTRPEFLVNWAENAVGQLFRVVAVSGTQVTLDTPLNLDFNPSLHPIARPQGFLENAGVEDLHIKRNDTSDSFTFYLQNVANVWIARVFSELTSKAHVFVITGYRVEIRDSYFHDATNFDGDGHGYGVQLHFHTTSCLVENNIFGRLRHSILLNVGPNGNVVGYNYSNDTTLVDVSVHGHYPFSNLYEGNVVEWVTVSDFWGPVGPHNLYFRNRLEGATLQVGPGSPLNLNVLDHSNYQNIVGNELVRGNVVSDNTVNLATLIVHGNREKGALSWDPTIPDRDLVASYYLRQRPRFYGSMVWPSTGSDRPNGTNPAQLRYLAGTPFATEPTLGIAVSIDQSTFSVGQTLSPTINIRNPGFTESADFYLGLLRPDGSILFLVGNGFVLGQLTDLASFRPAAIAVSLLSPFSASLPNVFSYQWRGDSLRGSYFVFLLVVKTGTFSSAGVNSADIVALGSASLSLQ